MKWRAIDRHRFRSSRGGGSRASGSSCQSLFSLLSLEARNGNNETAAVITRQQESQLVCQQRQRNRRVGLERMGRRHKCSAPDAPPPAMTSKDFPENVEASPTGTSCSNTPCCHFQKEDLSKPTRRLLPCAGVRTCARVRCALSSHTHSLLSP